MYLLLCVSRKCNLNCIGCHAHKSGEIVTEENLSFFKRCLIHTLQQYKPTHIVFHGAETFMCSATVLKEVLEVIRKYTEKNAGIRGVIKDYTTGNPIKDLEIKCVAKNCTISCMSNGTLITKEKLDIMRHYDVDVNISYRGPYDIYERITRSDTYIQWMEGMELVKPKSTIFYYPTELEDEVIDRHEEIIDDIVHWGYKSVRFSEYCSSNPNKRFAEFVIKCQEYIIKQGYDLEIAEIIDLLKRMQGLQPKMSCSWEHNCMRFFCLNPDGSFSLCNRNLKRYITFHQECLSCSAYPYCKGGCEAVRELNGGRFQYCEDRRKLVEYVKQNYADLATYYEIC